MKIFYYANNRSFCVPKPESFTDGIFYAHGLYSRFIQYKMHGICNNTGEILSFSQLHFKEWDKILLNIHWRYHNSFAILFAIPIIRTCLVAEINNVGICKSYISYAALF